MQPVDAQPVPVESAREHGDLLALPFDQFQRYTTVAQIADQVRRGLSVDRLRVLDVGGFFRTLRGESTLPLLGFLPNDQVTVVDLAAESLAHYVVADGRSLPFGSQSFDLVVSCDTLEHVSPVGRAAFVDELLRVTGRCLVLMAPFDAESTRLAERLLAEYLKAHGLHNDQLQEHIDRGLPDAGALRSQLSERGLEFLQFGEGYLHHWLLMMLIKHTPGQSLEFQLDLDRYYNRYLSPSDRREPAYRQVFVAVWPCDRGWLPPVAARLCPPGAPPASPDLGLVEEYIRGLNLRRTAALTEALSAAERQLADLRQTVAGYERGRFIRLMRSISQWRRRAGF